MEKFYAASWMSIGFATQYSVNDHAWSLEVLGAPLLLTRDSQGKIQVFHNVCRHRGHIVLDKVKAAGKLLRCPYHSWCYSLDGKFVSAPFWDGTEGSAPDTLQKKSMGLVPVEFTIWYDVIFINLSGNAPPFAEFICPLQSRWSRNRPQKALRFMSNKRFSIEGNWKLAAENFLDNYHLPWIHPEIGNSVEASLGLNVENLRLSENIIGFSHSTAGADKSKTTTPLPQWHEMDPLEAQRQDLFFLFPNTCFVMEGTYLWAMILQPLDVDKCEEQLALYVVGEEALAEKFKASRKQLCDLINNINAQDMKVIESLQKARKSDVASLGIYTPFHDKLGELFHQKILDTLLTE